MSPRRNVGKIFLDLLKTLVYLCSQKLNGQADERHRDEQQERELDRNVEHYRQRDRERKYRLKAVKDHRSDDLSDSTEVICRTCHQIANAVAMKILERLIDKRRIKILPHIKLDMPRCVDQQPSL